MAMRDAWIEQRLRQPAKTETSNVSQMHYARQGVDHRGNGIRCARAKNLRPNLFATK